MDGLRIPTIVDEKGHGQSRKLDWAVSKLMQAVRKIISRLSECECSN